MEQEIQAKEHIHIFPNQEEFDELVKKYANLVTTDGDDPEDEMTAEEKKVVLEQIVYNVMIFDYERAKRAASSYGIERKDEAAKQFFSDLEKIRDRRILACYNNMGPNVTFQKLFEVITGHAPKDAHQLRIFSDMYTNIVQDRNTQFKNKFEQERKDWEEKFLDNPFNDDLMQLEKNLEEQNRVIKQEEKNDKLLDILNPSSETGYFLRKPLEYSASLDKKLAEIEQKILLGALLPESTYNILIAKRDRLIKNIEEQQAVLKLNQQSKNVQGSFGGKTPRDLDSLWDARPGQGKGKNPPPKQRQQHRTPARRVTGSNDNFKQESGSDEEKLKSVGNVDNTLRPLGGKTPRYRNSEWSSRPGQGKGKNLPPEQQQYRTPAQYHNSIYQNQQIQKHYPKTVTLSEVIKKTKPQKPLDERFIKKTGRGNQIYL